jgi:hypothetical protein
VLFLELIVGFEGMRLHRGIARLQMRRQFDADHRRLTALLAPSRHGQTHGVGMRHATLQRLQDGGLQPGGAGLRQQVHQGGGDAAEIGTAFGGADQQGLAPNTPPEGATASYYTLRLSQAGKAVYDLSNVILPANTVNGLDGTLSVGRDAATGYDYVAYTRTV